MSSRLFVTLCAAFGSTALLLWPAFYNHQPFFFPDTTAYARGADGAVLKLTGRSSDWTPQNEMAAPVDNVPLNAKTIVPDKAVLAGRSIYYGALVYLGDLGGGEWLSIVLQSLLVVLALFGTLRLFNVAHTPYFLVLVVVLATCTVLPLYASFLMPDAFAGLTILACGILLTCDLKDRLALTAAWALLLTASLTFHNTHAIVASLMFGLGLLLYGWRRPLVMARGLIAVGMAVSIAFLFSLAFTLGVTRLLGEPPLSPPFLMARLIDDGPGYIYLRDTCPGSGFVACQFVDRLPVMSDDFLWAKDPQKGVFGASNPSVRRSLSREQYRFALEVMAHEPLRQIAISLGNAAEQLFLLKPTEFGYTSEEKLGFAQRLPVKYFAAMQATPAYKGDVPLMAFAVTSYLSTAVGASCLVYFWYSGRYRQSRDLRRCAQLTAWVVFGVLANAAVCGVISGPHDRYQARLAWLIPGMALIAHFQIYRDWWDKHLPHMA